MDKGEFRVGNGFNPSGNVTVDRIKRASADLIDLFENLEFEDDPSMTPNEQLDGERKRLKSLAQTAIEEGAMWAVKAATKR